MDETVKKPKTKKLRVLAILTVVVLFLFLGPGLWIRFNTRGLTYNLPLTVVEPKTQHGLVFGAGIYNNKVPTPILAARLDAAKQAYDAGNIKAIIVSGDNRADNYNEPAVMANYLVKQGIPEEVIFKDSLGLSTLESCKRAKSKFGADKVLLFTQSYHLPRAIYSCRSVGLDAKGVRADSNYGAYDQLIAEYTLREQFSSLKAVFQLNTNN